jgi:hypothetical protein
MRQDKMRKEMDHERKQPRTSTEKNREIAGLNDTGFKSVRASEPKAETRRATGIVKNSPCPTRKNRFKRNLGKATSLKEKYEITYAYAILEFEVLQSKLKLRKTLPCDPKYVHPPKKPKTQISQTEAGILEALKFGEQPAEIVAMIAKSNVKRVESIMHRMSMQNKVIRRRVVPDTRFRGHWMYSLPEENIRGES